jgi:hypothetical protein
VPDPVEIKVTLADDQVAAALDALGLDRPGQRRTVSFLEDRRAGGDALVLLDARVILRARENEGEADDSTAKLRPVRRSELTARWQHDDDLRVEHDWAGTRHVLAASLDADRPAGRIAGVRAGTEPVSRLFDDDQERFLADCAPIAVDLDALTLLPPVAAVRWKDLEVAGVPGRLVAERWVVGDLDFLELSARAGSPAEAESVQPALEAGVRALGLAIPAEQETKTRRVLEHLVRA